MKDLAVPSRSSGLIPLFVVAHFAHHLLTAILVPLLPMIRTDLGLDYTQSGFVVSAFNMSYGVGQLPGGWLSGKFGNRLMIAISIGGVALAGLLIGFSRGYPMLIALLILMGIMGGGYHPASSMVLSASAGAAKSGRALGIHLIGGSACYFLAPLIAAAIAAAWTWRGSYISLAIPGIMLGVFFYVLLGRNGAAAGNGNQNASISRETAAAGKARMRRLVMVIILAALTNSTITSVMAFIPLFLVDHSGVSFATAAASMSIFYSAGLWAGPLGGYISDRWGKVRLMLVVCLAGGPVIYLLNLVSYGMAFGAVLIGFGIIMYAYVPALQAYLIEQTTERNRSVVLGAYFFANMEGGGLLTPLVGFLIDRVGFSYTITAVSLGFLVIVAILSIFLRHD